MTRAPATAAPSAPETPAERAYREAEQRAEKKLGLYRHLVLYAGVMLFFIFTAGFEAAGIIGLLWGLYLGPRAFNVLWAPKLKAQWIDEEIGRFDGVVVEERGRIESRNAKRLEALSASIAHEIRNPITAAKSLLQQMGEDPNSPENVEYAHIALQELDRVERSITHLLKYARDEELHAEPLHMAEVIESSIESLKDRVEKRGVKVQRDFDGDDALRGDADKLRRVMINLVGNALDALEASDTASPEIVVSLGQDLAGRELWVKVKDNGPGIEPAQLEKIWSPFHTTKATGTGLGLAISKKLVEAHGGSIEVRSEPGRGAEFTVVLPRGEVKP